MCRCLERRTRRVEPSGILEGMADHDEPRNPGSGDRPSDRLYRWRGEIEQVCDALLETKPSDVVKAVRKRLDELADEIFEAYLNALEAERKRR